MSPAIKRLIGPLCVSVIMLAVTAVYWSNEEQEIAANRDQALERSARIAHRLIDQRLDRFNLLLRGVKGYYESSESVTREAFKHYVGNLQFDPVQVPLQGIAIALRIDHADKDRHTATTQAKVAPTYRIKPEGVRPEYNPIVLIEPMNAINERALGFDISTNLIALEALQRSLSASKTVLTGSLELVQDVGQNRPAMVMYVPLMAKDGKRVDGWVSGPFRIEDLVDAVATGMDPDVDLVIHDGAVLNSSNRVYGAAPADAAAPKVRTLEVGGRTWTLLIYATPEFEARFVDQGHWLIAIVGGLASILFGFAFWQMSTARARATTMALAMTRELREQQAVRQATLEAIPDLLFEVDVQGVILAYHASRTNLLAAPPEVFMGKNFAEVLPSEATEICMAAIRKAAVDGYYTGAVYVLPLDQGDTWFEMSVSALPETEGRERRFVLLTRDITERKTAELTLKASNAQLQLLQTCISRLNDIVLITEAEPFSEPGPRIVFVNDAFERRTGYSREEVIGKTPRILQGPKTDRKELDRIRAAMERWEPVRSELLNYTKAGEEFWIELELVPIADATGWFTHWIAVERDVTERRQTQMELQSSLREKTALLLEVHHRVKNNLQVITSLLRLESRRSTVEHTKYVLGDMQGRIRAMSLLHESLYRSDTLASIDLGNYLRQLATQAFQTMSTHSGAVQLKLNLGSVQIGMDQAISCGLLVNELITNCLKHAFPDGSTGYVSIDLQPLAAPNHWRLSVSDTGIGLPDNFEEKRENSLGLQLVTDLARQVGGELTIESKQDNGVSFTVNFQALEPGRLVMPA